MADTSSERSYKLGEFAKLMGVSVKSLQRWDKNGTLVADRTDGCHRFYTQKHIDELTRLREENSSKLERKKNYKYMDLTDMEFGHLKVLRRAQDWVGPNGHRHICWVCKCGLCGREVTIKGASLRAGYNKTCGCSQYGDNETKRMWREYHEMSPEEVLASVELKIAERPPEKPPVGHAFEDLTGRKFGFWRVIERAETRKYTTGQAVCWKCECRCGTVRSVPARDLKSGASQSCGCMSKISWLEYYVREYLDEHGWTYEYQKICPELLGIGGKPLIYDFVLEKNGAIFAVIECHGEQHYRPIKKFGGAKQLLKQQIHDKLKVKYAEEIWHVPVYEIPYTFMTRDDVYGKMESLNL